MQVPVHLQWALKDASPGNTRGCVAVPPGGDGVTSGACPSGNSYQRKRGHRSDFGDTVCLGGDFFMGSDTKEVPRFLRPRAERQDSPFSVVAPATVFRRPPLRAVPEGASGGGLLVATQGWAPPRGRSRGPGGRPVC